MGSMEQEKSQSPSEVSEANRAAVAALRRAFEPLLTRLRPELEPVVVYDAAAQTAVPETAEQDFRP